MIPKRRPRLGGRVARVERSPVGAGVGGAGDPARVADDDRPAVADRASHGPPDEISRRSLTSLRCPPGRPARRARALVAPGGDLRIGARSRAAGRPAASSGARSSRRSRYSAGRVVVAADRARGRRGSGTPMPGRRVGVGRAAGRGVGDLEAERSRDAPGRARRAGRCARASPSATSGPSARSRRSCRGPRSRRRSARISASAASSASRLVARTSTSSVQRSATTFGRVPPAMTPTLTVTPGQRPLSAWRSSTIRAASRIALRPFSGSTPAWAARPCDRRAAGRGCPCATRRCRRSRGRTRGRGARPSSAASAADVRRRGRRADLLVRVGDERRAARTAGRRARR